jgi:hypothetical protein
MFPFPQQWLRQAYSALSPFELYSLIVLGPSIWSTLVGRGVDIALYSGCSFLHFESQEMTRDTATSEPVLPEMAGPAGRWRQGQFLNSCMRIAASSGENVDSLLSFHLPSMASIRIPRNPHHFQFGDYLSRAPRPAVAKVMIPTQSEAHLCTFSNNLVYVRFEYPADDIAAPTSAIS